MKSGHHYTIKTERPHFLTMTIIDWVDLFTRLNHKMLIVDSLKYCCENKGLQIFAWCLMPSHLHLIADTDGREKLSDVVRDFKKFTSKKLILQIEREVESRRKWLLSQFEFAATKHPKNTDYKVWRDGNHPIEMRSERVLWQKIRYIHRNPVVDRIVEKEEEYLFSSARNYYGREPLLFVNCVTPPVTSIGTQGFLNV
ncbi:MAG: transposase [Bacteroidia bacterium]|nr:transposase [Bacteroidia bacterium]